MERIYKYDVAVAGAGPAGLAAALAASRNGAQTVLIEKNGFCGGECASANVPAYCAFFDRQDEPKHVAGGIALEFLEELKKLGMYTGPMKTPGKNYAVPADPETVKYVFDCMLEDEVDVMLHTKLIAAERNGNFIHKLVCSDDEGIFSIEASSYIDATGDACLSYLGGAETVYGDVNGKTQAAAMVMMLDGFDPEGNYSSAVLNNAVEQAEKDGIGPFSRRSGSLLRWLYDDCGTVSMVALELPSLAHENMTYAEQEGRKQAQAYLKAFRKYVPGMENVRLISTGCTLGIRETRKIIGTETLKGSDVLNAVHRNDGIGRGCWPVERHSDITKPAVFVYLPEKESYYDIPFGVIRSVNTENLFAAGRCVSADPEAFASVRVAGTCFVTGQAAGTAAALYLKNEENLEKYVQESLLRQGAIL